MTKTRVSIYVFIVLLLSVVPFTLMSGCSSSQSNTDGFNGNSYDYGINLSIVYCNRQNSGAGISEDKLGPYIMSALLKNPDSESPNQLNIISADGKPKPLNTKFEGSKKNSELNRKEENQETTKEVINTLENFNATTEESNIFDAISVANDYFDNSNSNQNVIVVCDSGISTKGVINFQNKNLFNANANDITSTTKLPDLQKTDRIVWMGFNQVCGEQDRMPSAIADNIKNLYTDLYKQGNVGKNLKDKKGSEKINDENIIEYISTNENNKSDLNKLPHVTTIKFPEADTDLSKFENGQSNNIIFNECQIRFEPDKATFVNVDQSHKILQGVADILNRHSNINVCINGYIASEGNEIGNLSQERADTVKNELIVLGVNNQQLKAVGKGKGPYPYIDESGYINSANRFIEIQKQTRSNHGTNK